MNELKRIAENFFYKEREIVLYGNMEQWDLNKMFENMVKHEAPDIVSVFDDRVVGIEHFQFDSFNNTKKGSELSEYGAKFRNGNEKIDYIKVNDMLLNRDINQYYNNFKKHFKKHYNKINNYKAKLEKEYPNKKVGICFFVEDVSLYGNFAMNDGKIKPLLPIYSEEVLEMLKTCEDVKYIYFFTDKVYDKINYYYDEQVTIFKNDEETRLLMKKSLENLDLQYCKFLCDVNEKGEIKAFIEEKKEN